MFCRPTLSAPVAALALAFASQPATAQQPLDDALAADMPGLLEIYRDLHAHPELSFQEVRSAKVMADAARKAGFTVTEKVGRTGVVAVMKNGPGPTVLIRADMDALPLKEQTGLPFASKVVATAPAGGETGVMHACGHDTHMTAWIATARQMAARKADWSGTLVMIGQPAEEVGLGAVAMLEDGLYTRFPKPDYTLAFHDTPQLPAGDVGSTPGWALANVDSVDIAIKGVGGHGAAPETTRDPIVLGAAIVNRLQTIASREISPQDPIVVTVGSFRGGTTYNIIPDAADLKLTVRTYSDETRAKVLAAIRRIVAGEAQAAGLSEDLMPTVTVEEVYTRSTYNSPAFTQENLAALEAAFGSDRVHTTPPQMVGEDFGEYRRADEDGIKSTLFWVGGTPKAVYDAAQTGGKPLPSLHSPFWKPEADKVIASGARALTLTSMRLMPRAR